MISCILTGHGSFALGMMGGLEMIAGPQELFEVIPFEDGTSLELFEMQMKQAVEKLGSESDGVLILSDLLGGTPFKTAMLASNGNDKATVLTGINLPILIEFSTMRIASENLQQLTKQMMDVGKRGIIQGQLIIPATNQSNKEEEGI